MYKLVDYQQRAVEKMLQSFKELAVAAQERSRRGDDTYARIVLKSPTGSGKTIMTADFLKQLTTEELPDKYVFVWAAPNKLHLQSYKKLRELLRDTSYDLIDIESLESGSLPENAILFTNWEKLYTRNKQGEWSNKAVKRGESEQNIQDVLDATRLEGLKVVLIVDESHQTFFGTNSQLITNEVIRPNFVIEVSATPKLAITDDDRDEDRGRRVAVKFSEVVDSGLIKQEILVNPQIDQDIAEGMSGIEVVFTQALRKRTELKKAYEARGLDINPILLVQLPNEKAETLTELDLRDKDVVEQILRANGITYGNGKLAVWLSGETKHLENIEKNDNEVEVLIFKQAIALGWDCPRAQILMMLRDVQSEVFRIQTVGRILRMPEAKHYEDSLLDAAYVYTDLSDIKVDPEDTDAKNLIKILSTKRRSDITNIKLPDSVYLHRTDYGSVRSDFSVVLRNILDQTFDISGTENMPAFREKIDGKLEIYPEELTMPIVADEVIDNLDAFDKEIIGTMQLKMDDGSVDRAFNAIIRSYMVPYKNFARSKSIVCGTLYSWFGTAGIYQDETSRIITCSTSNQVIFKQIFEAAKIAYDDLYKDEMAERRKRELDYFEFEIPATDDYADNHTWIPTTKNVMERYFRADHAPKTEIRFETLLEASQNVDWWYKNGTSMQRYFAIPYDTTDDKGRARRDSFYPDYIIRFTDGRVGIYDTKGGLTLEDKHTRAKANALQAYIAKHPELNLIGGIIDARMDGSFWLQDDTGYEADNMAKWKSLLL